MAVVRVQCPSCKAVCLRVLFPCKPEVAGTASLIVQSDTAELEYWPRALWGAVGHMQPSIRPDTPQTAWTDEEVERLKADLDRISFRRSTQSWQKFLDRLMRDPPALPF